MFKRLAVIAALSLSCAVAFAIPKPSEVKAAVASGNYVLAEQLLKQVMQEKPSARAHYDLGQVYVFEGKHNQALSEFRQAQALDPSLKFASSAAEFTKKLANEQNLVAPPPVVAQVSPAPTYTVPSIPSTAATTATVQHDGGGSSFLPALLVILLLSGVAVGAYFVVSGKRQKKQEEDAATASKREKNTTLLGFSKSLEDATLICKTATYGDAQKRQILDRITGLQSTVRTMIGDLKDGKEVSASRMAQLESNVNMAVDQATNGVPAPTPAVPASEHSVEVAREYTPRAEADVYTANRTPAPAPMGRPAYVPTPAPAPTVVHHYHEPAPAPVIVNNNDGLLTGILIGNALGDHHHDRVIEREVFVERAPRIDTPRYERDSYEDRTPAPAPYYAPAPAPAPTFDSNDDQDDYAASPPAVDSSSDDSDTY